MLREVLSPASLERLQELQGRLTAAQLAGGLSDGPVVIVDRPLADGSYWDGVLQAGGSVLISPGAGPLEAVVRGLSEAGYAGPLVLILQPLTSRQRSLPRAGLEDLPDPGGPWLLWLGRPEGPPSLESLPLYGISVVVTRELQQGQEVVDQLRTLGADVVICPVMAFVPPDDPEPLRSSLERLEGYDWLLFTSANGVEAFLQALRGQRDLRALGHLRLGAIGPGTAEALGRWHLNVDCLPEEYVAEGFLAALERFPLEGKRFLLARAQEAREVLPQGLRQRGAQVEVVPVYQTVTPEPAPGVIEAARRADWVLLTSSSCAKNYTRLLGGIPAGQKALAIGPVTAATASQLGWPEVEMAEEYTMEGMLRKLRSAV